MLHAYVSGQEIEDWLIGQDLFLLNNGSTTRHSRIAGHGSTHGRSFSMWQPLDEKSDLASTRADRRFRPSSNLHNDQPMN